MVSKPRYTMQLNLRDGTFEQLNAVSDRIGMSKTVLAERVFDWFSQQPELVQLRVLGILSDELAGKVGRMVLEEMAEAGSGKKSR